MNHIILLAILFASLNLCSGNFAGIHYQQSIVTEEFLNELDNRRKTVTVPEQRIALGKFHDSLKADNYELYANNLDYLYTGKIMRFNRIDNHPLFKSLFLENGLKWGQTRGYSTYAIDRFSLDLRKYQVRPIKSKKRIDGEYRQFKIWILTISNNEDSEHYVFCEKGFHAFNFVDETPQQIAHAAIANGELADFGSPGYLSAEYGLQDLPALFPDAPSENDSIETIPLPADDADEILRAILDVSDIMPTPAPVPCLPVDNSSLMDCSLRDLLSTLGPQRLITYIQNLDKENMATNSDSLPSWLKPVSSIKKPQRRAD